MFYKYYFFQVQVTLEDEKENASGTLKIPFYKAPNRNTVIKNIEKMFVEVDHIYIKQLNRL